MKNDRELIERLNRNKSRKINVVDNRENKKDFSIREELEKLSKDNKKYYTTPSVNIDEVQDWCKSSTNEEKEPVKKETKSSNFFINDGVGSSKSIDDILADIKTKLNDRMAQRKEEENKKAKELWDIIYSMTPALRESMNWVNQNKEVTYSDLKRVYDFYIDFWRLLFESIK